MIDFIIPVRDRDLPRIQNCIDSIQGKEVGKIYVIDYGSKEPINEEELSRCEVITVHKSGYYTWNKSHALNIGIQKSRAKYVAAMDCDIILPDNFIDEAAKVLDDKTFVLSNSVRRIEYFNGEFKDALESSTPWKPEDPGYQKAVGGIQIFPRKWAVEHQGYDESLTYWNGTDTYMYYVAHESMMHIKNIPLIILHQEHEFKKEENLTSEIEKEVARQVMSSRGGTTKKLAREAARKARWGKWSKL